MTIVRVLVEYRGSALPAIIWQGRRGWQQWLAPETVEIMGLRRTMQFWAKRIDSVWHIERPCAPLPVGETASILRKTRTDGRVLAPWRHSPPSTSRPPDLQRRAADFVAYRRPN